MNAWAHTCTHMCGGLQRLSPLPCSRIFICGNGSAFGSPPIPGTCCLESLWILWREKPRRSGGKDPHQAHSRAGTAQDLSPRLCPASARAPHTGGLPCPKHLTRSCCEAMAILTARYLGEPGPAGHSSISSGPGPTPSCMGWGRWLTKGT